MRKSDIRSLKAFKRVEVMSRREVGRDDVSIITVVFGGRDIAWEMRWRAAAWIRWREMDERAEEVRREV
jgi:hypothetical protein